MKIAGIIFESLLKAGGYEVFTYNLHTALAARGHDVTLYLPQAETRKHRAFYAALPFTVRPMIARTWFFLKRAPALLQWHLAREQARHGYDAWQVMGTWPEGFAALRVPAPKVLRNYGEDIQMAPALGYGLRRDPERDRTVRRVLRSVDRVVAMTESLASLQRELGVPDERIVRIPNGISLERFRRPVDRRAARERLGMPQDVPVILTVGRNHPKKGFDLIPGMAARLKAAGLDFRWLVLGGETERLLPALRAALNPFVILGMGMHFVALAIWLYALSKVDVSYAYPFIALGFVLVLAYAHFFLHEDVNAWRLAGVLLICGGVALVARS